MEHSRRKEVPQWLNTTIHVWNTKNDIPVVNLRDASETLGSPRSTRRTDGISQTPDEDSFRAEGASCNSEKSIESTTQKKLNAFLAVVHERSENQKTVPPAVSNTLSNNLNLGGESVATDHGARAPSFPEVGPSKAMDVVFVRGVNLPGGKNVTASLQLEEKDEWELKTGGIQSVPLFQDDIWCKSGSSFNIDSFTTKEEDKADILSSLKLQGFTEGIKNNEETTTDTTSAGITVTPITATTVQPPPFPVSVGVNDATFQTSPAPTVVPSPAPSMVYPQVISLGAPGFAAAPTHTAAMAVPQSQFVALPVSFMPQASMMAMPQAYRMPHQFYQMHPQLPQRAQLHYQHAVYQPTGNPEFHQMSQQTHVAPQNPSPRPGTNIGAAPFVPGGKGI
ncbi:uncharacterized protein TM35_000071150 [Trypanosoma theileri]|uniref:Uncharacterized protein n=1 Tax=Trypanosoma theileri TaxID=67003 RepID=A0A1X0P1I8_9TRYP|nr:uncharacterized protein TM35_000071150 [Trypanosoma theileri]ORC90691.1 hypothetical protein TM35_000071150 [Trypanosoma theileri]